MAIEFHPICTERLTKIVLQHIDGFMYMLSADEYEWMEQEYEESDDEDDLSCENLFGHIHGEEQLQVVDGQDFSGLDMALFQDTEVCSVCIPVTFVGCNFSGLDLTNTFFAECEFEDCNLEGTVGIDID